MDERSETLSDAETRNGGSLRRWLIPTLAVILLVGATAAGVLFARDGEDAPAPVRRSAVVADLLGWIPATAETRRAFAVWSADPDAGAGTPAASSALDPLIEQLGLTPMPLTLGRSNGWRDRFGYGARDVEAWAAAGSDAPVAILGGNFDRGVIEQSLTDAGYRRTSYHDVPLYILSDAATPSTVVAGDAVSAANAIALYSGRLITATSPDAARSAIDAAQGRAPSLADDPTIAAILDTLAPLNGLVAVDAADHAIDCGLGRGWTFADLPDPSGRYVAVGYGRLGAGGERRTMVAMSFPDPGTAEAASIVYDAGWRDGLVYAGGAGADIAAFGRIGSVSQTGSLLVAELVEGREAGWVRAGIRFAAPVCEAATTALPEGTPVPQSAAQPVSGLSRVLASLGDIGSEGTLLVADLAAIAQMRDVAPPPEANLTAEAVQQWLDQLAPLPAFTALPRDAAMLALWPDSLGIPLGSITAVGEVRPGEDLDSVAVLVGTWDRETVEDRLRGLGYAAVRLGAATVFQFSDDAATPNPVDRVGGAIWRNVAVVDNRIFLSTSSRSMREAVRAGMGTAPFPTPAGDAGFSGRLLLTVPNVTAAEIVGADAEVRACVSGSVSGHRPDWLGIAAIWSAGGAAGDTAAIAVSPGPDASLSALGGDLDSAVKTATLHRGDGATEELPLAQALGYTGTERHDADNKRSVAVARFTVPASSAGAAEFFVATVEACDFRVSE